MKEIESYEVYEDNAGGLYLATLTADGVANVYSGYEYRPGALLDDIKALISQGGDWYWDSAESNPGEYYQEISNGIGCELIAEGGLGYTVSLGHDNGRRDRTLTVHFDRLGVAGSLEFKALLPGD